MSFIRNQKIYMTGNSRVVTLPKGFKLREQSQVRVIADGIIILCDVDATPEELLAQFNHILEELKK